MLTKTVEGGEPELVLSQALNAHAGPQKRVFSEAPLSPTPLLSSLLPELARAGTRQSCDANARFSRDLFLNEALNAALHSKLTISKKSDK
jgi:hypothetical protein